MRYITASIKSSLDQFPVILINGARAVGKSMLVQKLVAEGVIKRQVTLGDIATLCACKKDPQGFINQFKESVAIEEIQRCPELFLSIKQRVEEQKEKGQFVLTSSANIISKSATSDSFPNKMEVFSLEGLLQTEIVESPNPGSFWGDLFLPHPLSELAHKWHYENDKKYIGQKQVSEAIFYGGFPEVVLKKNELFKNKWMNAYLNEYVQRDILEFSKTIDIVGFASVVQILNNQTGQLLNVRNLGTEVGLDQRTVSRYLEIMFLTFQAHLLQPYCANLNKRFVKTPKIFAQDTGFSSFMMGIESVEQLEKSPQYAHLLETWVYGELRKLAALKMGVRFYFYRTHLGKKVDFVLEKSGRLVGIECKSSASVRLQQVSGLQEFVDMTPHSYGVVLYGGNEVVLLQDNIIAVPFSVALF